MTHGNTNVNKFSEARGQSIQEIVSFAEREILQIVHQ